MSYFPGLFIMMNKNTIILHNYTVMNIALDNNILKNFCSCPETGNSILVK